MGRGALQKQEPPVMAVKRLSPPLVAVSHNLNGQKLGRKGRLTRERILAATSELLAESEEPISLSAVARRASLGMTSLYNYFTDLTELLLAVLEPVMQKGAEDYAAQLSQHWSDEELGSKCSAFVQAMHGFWSNHARLLHLRNAMADGGDRRMLMHRVTSTQPLIGFLARQMGGDPDRHDSEAYAMATVLMTGIERVVTVVTDKQFTGLFGEQRVPRWDKDHYLRPQARMMELAIRDMRARLKG
jgi:AcrR family transcriptional regulator